MQDNLPTTQEKFFGAFLKISRKFTQSLDLIP